MDRPAVVPSRVFSLTHPLVAGSIIGEERFETLYQGYLAETLPEKSKLAFFAAAAERVRRIVRKKSSLTPEEQAWLVAFNRIPEVRARTLGVSNQVEAIIQSIQQAEDSGPAYPFIDTEVASFCP